MGFFNILFGGRKNAAKDVLIKSEKRIPLFNKHLSKSHVKINYFLDHSDNKLFLLVKDPDRLNGLLDEIEANISRDLIDIEGEEKLESDIIADLERLNASGVEVMLLQEDLRDEINIESNIQKIFHKYYEVLATELRMVQLIRTKLKEKDLGKVKELLSSLRKLITVTEIDVSNTFSPGFGMGTRGLPFKLKQVIRAVLLEQEINEKELVASKKFSRSVKKRVKASPESKSAYKKWFDNIYITVINKAGAPFADYTEFEKGRKEMDRIIFDDTNALRSIILAELKKRKKVYTDEDVTQIIEAFRDAYAEGKFSEVSGIDLYT